MSSLANGNDIIRPVTADEQIGFDSYDQLWWWRPDPDGSGRVGTIIADVRGKTCAICARGWELTGAAFADQIHWQLIDDFVHRSCFIRHEALIERSMFYNALCDAHVRFSGLKELPNGYWREPDPWAAKPWYSATLLDHPARFVLGWRKNVAHIELVSQKWFDPAKFEAVFRDERVTKEFRTAAVLVHAWGRDKVREYIRLLVETSGYDYEAR